MSDSFENSKTNVSCHIHMRTHKTPNGLISRKLVGQREWEDIFKELEKDSAMKNDVSRKTLIQKLGRN